MSPAMRPVQLHRLVPSANRLAVVVPALTISPDDVLARTWRGSSYDE